MPNLETQDARGKFKKGNPGGPGNPFSKKTNELRAALYAAVGTKEIAKVIKAQLALASSTESGSTAAATLLFNVLGLTEKQIAVGAEGKVKSITIAYEDM